jgi:murein DD-endopeptidase MepM/ murein hydrolase activator NlpD
LPNVYRGRARRTIRDLYDEDHNESRRGGRFRWLLSTCLGAMVAAVAIAVVLFGSLDRSETADGVMPTLERLTEASQAPAAPVVQQAEGLNWAVPKSDRLLTTASAAKQVIHDQVQIRRDNRPFIEKRRYLRVFARLSDTPGKGAELVPPFNPLQLYAASAASEGQEEGPRIGRANISVQVLELFGGILPSEDGQELDNQEVTEIVTRAAEAELDGLRPGLQPDPVDTAGARGGTTRTADQAPPNTTILPKSSGDADEGDDDLEKTEIRSVKVARGDTLVRILQRYGAESWQARAMVEAARNIMSESALAPGQEVQVTLVASLTKPDKMEPARFTVLTENQDHKVTVYRNAAGEFVATATPPDTQVARPALSDKDQAQSSSLYATLYRAGLQQGLPTDTILQAMRVHAYETDFRRRVRHGDMVDFFFDLKEEGDLTPGELLYTAITSGGQVQRFWRYRTPDGVVDYYDEAGDNSKKFLMRRPVRGEDVRLTSGYGVRFHPILNISRMHTGVDWAAPQGTPILAAGAGTIEEAGRKGQNGNYVRIRHANGYHTAYSHMSRIGAGITEGLKVRQGEVIGYVGCTGLCNGPHLHYEVLVNTRFVDPLEIQVPRERKLAGRQLAEFQKERARIDDLMRRSPVQTASR